MALSPIQTNPEQEVFARAPSGPTPADEMAGLPEVVGAPYAALAKVGNQLADLGTKLMTPEMQARGAAAVGRDGAGNATFEPRIPLNSLDEAYNQAGLAKFGVDTEQDIRAKLFDLHQQNVDDPAKFQQLGTTYVKALAGGSGVPTQLRSDILTTGLGLVQQHFETLAQNKRTTDTAEQLNALESNVKAEVQTTFLPLARQGGENTPQFAQSVGKIQNLMNAMRNPVFHKSDDELNNEFQSYVSQAHAEAGLGAAMDIYKAHGVQAAVDAGDKIFYDPVTGLTPDLSDKYHSQLHRDIDQLETEKRQGHEQAVEAIMGQAEDATAAASNGQDWEKVISRDTLRSVLGPQADHVIAGLDATADTASQAKSIATMSPADIAARLKGLDPKNLDLPGGAAPPAFGEADAQSYIRQIFPGAVITSGQRTPAHNADVGGVPDSQHLNATATDFVLPQNKTFADVKADLSARGLPVSELIDEGDHIHWAWGDKSGAAQPDDGTTRYGYAADLRRFGALKTAVAQRQQALADDPAGYVLSSSPMVQALAQQAQGGDPHAQARYTSTLLSEQERMGVPTSQRQVLTKAQADYVANDLLAAPPDMAVASLGKLTAGLPQDALNIISRQVSPKNRAVGVAIGVAAQDPGLARSIIIGQRFLNDNPDARPNDKILGGTIDRLTGGSDGWFSSTGGLFQFAPDARAAAMAAGAAVYASKQIGKTPGTLDKNGLDAAITQVLGNPFTFRGQKIIPPTPSMHAYDVADLMGKVDDNAVKQFGNGQPVDATGRPISSQAISKYGILTYSGTAGKYRIMLPGQGHIGVAGNADGAKTFMLDLGAMASGGNQPVASPAPPVGQVMPPQDVLKPQGERVKTPIHLFTKDTTIRTGGRR